MWTTFEKFRQSGPLMVPSCSIALSSMCGTILVAVGQHWSVRSTGAMPLYVDLVVHASLSWPCWSRLEYVSHVSCVLRATGLAHISSVSLVSRLSWPYGPPCMHEVGHASHAVDGPLRQAVREDHLQEVSSERPSEVVL